MPTDTLNIAGAINRWPDHWKAAYQTASSADYSAFDDFSPANVVILGMGGSGIGGNLVAAAFSDQFVVPMTVVNQYELPGFVNEKTLVFAMSYSGTTEETVTAATAAGEAGARIVSVCTGGELSELAEKCNGMVIPCVSGLMPRVALCTLVAPLIAGLGKFGLIANANMQSDAVLTQLETRRAQCELGVDPLKNPARELARKIERTIPLLYGGGAMGEAAAVRWKRDINENAKAPAYASGYPEIDHNEICSFGQHGDVTRQILTLVELRHDFEHPQVSRRFEITRELIREALNDVLEVRAAGATQLAQALDLVYVGAWTSLYMAYLADVDPGPIPAIDQLKSSLK